MTEEKKHIGDRHLRNRPFLIVETVSKPSKNVRTEVGGWPKTEKNWQTFEIANVHDRVNEKHMIDAAVIIDLVNETVIKSRFEGISDEELVKRFVARFYDKVVEGMTVWNNRVAAAKTT